MKWEEEKNYAMRLKEHIMLQLHIVYVAIVMIHISKEYEMAFMLSLWYNLNKIQFMEENG